MHQANPNDGEAPRDLSVSLNRLGDFFLKRGLEGDADRALGRASPFLNPNARALLVPGTRWPAMRTEGRYPRFQNLKL
jgi:hypothetical protein